MPLMKPLVWRRSFLLRSEREVGAILIFFGFRLLMCLLSVEVSK